MIRVMHLRHTIATGFLDKGCVKTVYLVRMIRMHRARAGQPIETFSTILKIK
jgi:hypothetical protein